MSTNYKLVTVITFYFFCFSIQAQILYTMGSQSEISENIIANLRADNNFEIFDVELTGTFDNTSSIALFNNGETAIGLEDGFILCNSRISDFLFGNTATGIGSIIGTPGDPNLNIIEGVYSTDPNNPVGNIPTFDASVIEFKFIPTNTRLTLEYVFASEEYCDFVGSFFNDKMGIFLSGPGISGPFNISGQEAINIAEFVDALGNARNTSINNINHINNSDFYIDNNISSTIGSPTCSNIDISQNQFTQLSQFDGWTTPMLARYDELQIGETYSIRIVVADGSDRIFGSAIFLKSRGFDAGQDLDGVADAGDDQLLPCDGSTITIGGTNTSQGPDFSYQWADPSGSIIATTPFVEVSEPGEYVLTVTNNDSGGQGFDTVIVAEQAGPMLIVETTDASCFSLADGSISISPSGGEPPYLISLSSGSVNDNNLPAGIYSATISDALECDTIIEFEINEPDALSLDFTITSEGYLQATVLGGTPPYGYSWNVGADSATIINPINGTNYVVTITDSNACQIVDDVFFSIDAVSNKEATLLNCHPNPAYDMISIAAENISSAFTQIIIYDIQGRQTIFDSQPVNQNLLNISLKDFIPGTYFIHATIDDRLFYQKLIILK